MTPDIADSLGLDEAMGALVSTVNEASPAQAAGLEPGDVIVSFDGKSIEKMRDLPRIVAETEIGATVDVELIRNGSRTTVQVTLGELEKAELVGIVGEQSEGEAESFEKLGFSWIISTQNWRPSSVLMTAQVGLSSPRWLKAALRPARGSSLVT